MKKLFCIFCMVMMLFSCCALAEEITSGDWSYILLEDGTAQVTRCNNLNDVISVPAQLDGYTVSRIGSINGMHVISDMNGTVKEIILPDTLKVLGKYSILAPIAKGDGIMLILPDSIEIIESDAVYMTPIAKLHLPINVLSIGNYAFNMCSAKEIDNVENGILTFPATLQTLGSGMDAILSNKKITEMILPEGLVSVGDSIIGSFVEKITLPESLTEIASRAFSGANEKKLIVYATGNTYAAQWAKDNGYTVKAPK